MPGTASGNNMIFAREAAKDMRRTSNINVHEYFVGNRKNIIKLLRLIESKLEKGKTIGIILGATYKNDATCDVNLYFNSCKDDEQL